MTPGEIDAAKSYIRTCVSLAKEAIRRGEWDEVYRLHDNAFWWCDRLRIWGYDATQASRQDQEQRASTQHDARAAA